MTRRRLTRFALATLALAAYLAAGELDYRDAVREEAHYCRMVAQGHWPAYRPNTPEICNGRT